MKLMRTALIIAACAFLPLAAHGQSSDAANSKDAAAAKAKAAVEEAKQAVDAAADAAGKEAEAKGAAAKDAKAKAKAKAKSKAKKAKAKAKKALRKKLKGKKGQAAKAADTKEAAGQQKTAKKLIQPLNIMKFTLGVGLATISSHPSAPAGEEAHFSAKGHSMVGVAIDLGKWGFSGLHPFVYYNYLPIDISVRSGVRTFRGVWHGHQIGGQVVYQLAPSHGLTAGLGITATVTELNPSDLLKEYAAEELVESGVGFHAGIGYEYAMMTSFRIGAQFDATFGTIGYTTAQIYSSFLL